MIELTKTASGYDVLVGDSYEFNLPSDDEIKRNAIEECILCEGEDSEAVRILRSADVSLEVAAGKDDFEKLIGVVVATDAANAKILNSDWAVYSGVMSALGMACSSIESDRVAVRA
ncbi:hypothetical protein LOC67_22595 [Stieleria sp. JC731]|uniref:hypothetical protein n=1 Tax=Stieleria sp. JC731 TaxID=2894195 RepID=UPI001E64525E|nr:hypothetical protein [Stieleria sp. JC731]MCC9603349.1 hypothetical protein [Stieleria sp. JC731]